MGDSRYVFGGLILVRVAPLLGRRLERMHVWRMIFVTRCYGRWRGSTVHLFRIGTRCMAATYLMFSGGSQVLNHSLLGLVLWVLEFVVLCFADSCGACVHIGLVLEQLRSRGGFLYPLFEWFQQSFCGAPDVGVYQV